MNARSTYTGKLQAFAEFSTDQHCIIPSQTHSESDGSIGSFPLGLSRFNWMDEICQDRSWVYIGSNELSLCGIDAVSFLIPPRVAEAQIFFEILGLWSNISGRFSARVFRCRSSLVLPCPPLRSTTPSERWSLGVTPRPCKSVPPVACISSHFAKSH